MIGRLALVVVVQLTLVGLAVAPQLSARVTGDEYRFRVAPVDPIDPFRGAYVDLDYPELRRANGSRPPHLEDSERGDVFITLVEADGFWTMAGYTRTRPDDGPYLACSDRSWEIRCGIESWFASQSDARELERALADTGAIATVRIDSRGNAALVALEPQ